MILVSYIFDRNFLSCCGLSIGENTICQIRVGRLLSICNLYCSKLQRDSRYFQYCIGNTIFQVVSEDFESGFLFAQSFGIRHLLAIKILVLFINELWGKNPKRGTSNAGHFCSARHISPPIFALILYWHISFEISITIQPNWGFYFLTRLLKSCPSWGASLSL